MCMADFVPNQMSLRCIRSWMWIAEPHVPAPLLPFQQGWSMKNLANWTKCKAVVVFRVSFFKRTKGLWLSLVTTPVFTQFRNPCHWCWKHFGIWTHMAGSNGFRCFALNTSSQTKMNLLKYYNAWLTDCVIYRLISCLVCAWNGFK